MGVVQIQLNKGTERTPERKLILEPEKGNAWFSLLGKDGNSALVRKDEYQA